jgi:hypothetical protein
MNKGQTSAHEMEILLIELLSFTGQQPRLHFNASSSQMFETFA